MKTSSDEHPKELVNQGQTEKLPSVSGDFWTPSACDMDNSAGQSLGSMSSISASVQVLDPHGGVGNTNSPSEFVNHGFLLWCQTRQHWVGNKKFANRGQQVQEPKLRRGGSKTGAFSKFCWNASYESLLGSNKPFPQPIPLSEMVGFLVGIWEQEGLYE